MYVLRWLAVLSDCTGALVENDTQRARHNQYTHELRISPRTVIHHTQSVHGLKYALNITPMRIRKKVVTMAYFIRKRPHYLQILTPLCDL